jgi:hypothetical protein
VEWKAITDALVAAEKALYPAGTTVIYAAGYTSDTGPAVYTRDYTISPDSPVAGTYSPGTNIAATGDDAAWVRWFCGQTNSRGKKIYIRKYFHGVYAGPSGGDGLATTQKSAYQTFANLLQSGLAVTGYTTRHVCDKNGHVATSNNVVTYITTRTLKRRSGSPL